MAFLEAPPVPLISLPGWGEALNVVREFLLGNEPKGWAELGLGASGGGHRVPTGYLQGYLKPTSPKGGSRVLPLGQDANEESY